MATYVNNFRTGYKLECECFTVSQNVANNTTTVRVAVYLTSTGSSYTINSSVDKDGSITVNGTSYGFTCRVNLSGGQRKGLYTKDITITHNSDGTKSFGVSASVDLAVTLSGKYWGTVSTSGTYTPATIPRGSSFSLSSSTLTLGGSITVNITRNSSSFTHKVYGKFGNMSSYTCFNSSAGTSATWSTGIDASKYIPSATSATGYIYIETYNGSTKIATSSTKTFTVNVPSSVVPTISALTVSENGGSGISGVYVKGKSKANVSITAYGAHGSSIVSRTTTITGMSSNGNTSFTTGIFTSAGSKTITTTVKDSRGRSVSKSVTINIVDYWTPQFSLTAYRANSDGTQNDGSGTHIKFTYAVTSYADLSSKNTLSYKVEVKNMTDGGATWAEKASGTGLKSSTTQTILQSDGSPYDTNKVYNVRITVTDKYGTYNRTVEIPTAFVTMDFLTGGTGVAFGKVATSANTFDVGLNQTIVRGKGIFKKGYYVHNVWGGSSGGTYMKVATIVIKANYANSPINIRYVRRDTTFPIDVSVRFTNVGNTDPALDKLVVRGTGNKNTIAIHKSATSTWDLYIQTGQSYDDIGIVDVACAPYQWDKMELTWQNQEVSALPSGATLSTIHNTFRLSQSSSWWYNSAPVIGENGVMEIGRYIDFHSTNETTNDYTARINNSEAGQLHFEASLQPNSNNSRTLGKGDYRWQTVYSVNALNASSDRSMKENISYINSKARTSDQVTYNDMYNFVKDDLELATYNFKGQEEQKMNFIAQDLLYNLDGTDSKVGQMIINPVAPPTEEEIAEAKSKLEEGQEYEYPTLSYDSGMYVSVLAGALKEAINEIEILKAEIVELRLSLQEEDTIKEEEVIKEEDTIKEENLQDNINKGEE